MKKKNPSIPKALSFGSPLSSGLYGGTTKTIDTTYHIKAPTVSFGNISIKNTIVKFNNGSSSTIGNKLLKNYDVVINWFTKEILLVERKEYDNSTISNFGFSYSNQENHLIVDHLYENSSAFNEGLKLGDQIMKIGDVTYGNLSQEQWCDIFENKLFGKDEKEILITVLRNDEELNYTLTLNDLIFHE